MSSTGNRKIAFDSTRTLYSINYFLFFEIASIFDMTIKAPSEKEAKKVKIAVSRDPVTTSFEKWACD